ncbi:MAG TPA: helix-turn-helix transcriptional regulator [Rhizomicrobium sp.]|jgi:AraC-like DNA-binding protein|nr:helix-turn-helix transcriptional regulator [Rhizomicrobium sp.]
MAIVADGVSASERAWEPKPPDFRFSTDDMPAADRVAIFREIVSRQMLRHDMVPCPDLPFHVHGVARPLPEGVFAVWSTGTPHVIRRTREYLSDGDDSLLFQWTNSTRSAEHLGPEVDLDPGDAILFSCSEPRIINLPVPFETVTLKVPRKTLGPLLVGPDACLGRPVPGKSPALRLLLRYLEALREESPVATAELQELAVAHICDLLAVVFGPTRDAAETAQKRGARAARLVAIKADIERNLADSCLSVAVLAARHGMTPRSLQMLFEDCGTTLTEFLRERRLARAYRMLISRRFSGQRIADIAFDCGFGDISYFNRSFRACYGATPSDVRTRDA